MEQVQFLPEGFRRALPLPETQAGFAQAMEQGVLLEAPPLRCDRQRNLHFRLSGFSAIMPREECAMPDARGEVREIALLSRVGQPTCFLIDAIEEQEGAPLFRLSRRRAQERCWEALLHLPLGTVLPAVVTHLERFGAFVDIGCGIPSLLPLNAISVSRIPHPSSRFYPGDQIYVVLREKLPEQGRLLLSHKELMGTWAENAVRFQSGEVVTGMVRGVMDYGIFVELAPNLPGLAEPLDGIADGDRVAVYIKSILPEKEKIKLLILNRLEPTGERQRPIYFTTGGAVQDWHYHRERR